MIPGSARGLAHISAQALVPEQLLHYVRAVGESRPRLFGPCVGHVYQRSVVLVAYPPDRGQSPADPHDPDIANDVTAAVEALLASQATEQWETITVLAPFRPAAAPTSWTGSIGSTGSPANTVSAAKPASTGSPANTGSGPDRFWMLPLPPPPPSQKLRSLLRRGARDIRIEQSRQWTLAHSALVERYCRTRPLAAGTQHIFRHMQDYLASSPEVLLFSAYSRHDGSLQACALGDYSALRTAFYMFAFRQPDAPSGSSDCLLEALCAEGLARGHSQLNLGLGINAGIAFFKHKWQALPGLPYTESTWKPQPHTNPQPDSRPEAQPVAQPAPRPYAQPEARDPLANPLFRKPGIWECLRDFVGGGRPTLLDCLQVEVSSLCPGRCLYCPHTTESARWLSRAMDAATFAALWPLLRVTGRVHLQGWGEPLLHPRFFDFAALARKAGCQVSTTTCGLHMHEHLARQIVNSGMDVVAFSLVGTDPASNAPRVGVPFAQVCAAITLLDSVRRRCHSPRPEIHLAYLLLADPPECAPPADYGDRGHLAHRADSAHLAHPPHLAAAPGQNLAALQALPALMDRLGADCAVVSTLDYLASPAHAGWAFAPHEQEKIAHARTVLDQVTAEAARRGKRLHYSLPTRAHEAAAREAAGKGGATGDPYCRENVQRNLYVDADGLLAPCIYLNLPTSGPDPQRRVFGSLHRAEALALWQGDDFCHFRQELAEGRAQGACLSCPKRFLGPELA